MAFLINDRVAGLIGGDFEDIGEAAGVGEEKLRLNFVAGRNPRVKAGIFADFLPNEPIGPSTMRDRSDGL